VAEDAAVKVSTLLPFPGAAMPTGLKPAVTPDGRPVTESAIKELNPHKEAVVTVIGVLAPCTSVGLVVDADRLKLETTAVSVAV